MKTTWLPKTFSIGWLRNQYLSERVTPMEVIQMIVQRVHEDVDNNVWITPPSLSEIKPYLEGLASLDREQYPLWGIPFAVKDNIDVAGMLTTAACPQFAYSPKEHSAVVSRLVKAGAIPVGKTNLDQFATGLVGTRSPYGEVRNALRPDLISGGSSSGSAVAVALGHVAFALGTDTAGSGRVPAALNRLVGFKPSLGAWSTKGVVPACASLDSVTVFSHSLEEVLAVDRVVRGTCSDDPWSRDIPHPSVKLPRKICLPREPLHFFGSYGENYKTAWHQVITTLEKMDIPVEHVDAQVFFEAGSLLYDGPWIAERWADLGDFISSHPGKALPVTEQILRTGTSIEYTAPSMFQALHRLQRLKLETRKLLKGYVLIMPTTGGTWRRNEVRADPLGTNRDLGIYTNHCNLLDLCALALPALDAESNVPFGITMYALSESENLLFGVAEKFVKSSSRP